LSSNGARTMTIKTLAAVVGTLAIIVVLLFITKITTPSRLVAKSGFFAGSSTDDWGRGTGATGFAPRLRLDFRPAWVEQRHLLLAALHPDRFPRRVDDTE
jgi:hypothetical protein